MTKDEMNQEPDGEDTDLFDTYELLRKWDEGDKDALNKLIMKYLPQLQQFVHRKLPFCLRGKLETWDGVDKVCELALRDLQAGKFKYLGVGRFWGWLRTIALNWIRRELNEEIKRRKKFVQLDESDDYKGKDPDLISLISQKEQIELVEECLASLEEKERCAFLLNREVRAIGEVRLTWLLIAEVCGYPSADAARLAGTRAIQKIRKCMEKKGHGGPGLSKSAGS